MKSDPINMIVAGNISVLMSKKNFDAASLARAAGLNPTGIYDILKGKSRSPKVETIDKIAKGFGVPTSLMFSENILEDMKDDFAMFFAQLPAKKRKMLLQIAQAWASDTAA